MFNQMSEVLDTKQKILDAAEVLFAAEGLSSTSIRAIVKSADVNVASVNYHFGSKEELIRQVFSRRIKPVNDERLKKLETLKQKYNKNPIPLKELLDAFLEPVFREFKREDRESFLNLMGRAHTEISTELKKDILSNFRDVAISFLKELSTSLPNVPKAKLANRFFFTIGALVHTMLNMTSSGEPEETLPIKVLQGNVLEDLIEYAASGISCSEEIK